MNDPRPELADVFPTHQSDFLKRWNRTLSRHQSKALRDIQNCRTAALGGHLQQCDRCGHRVLLYNSCRNRNCPKCQATARARWLAQRQTELLPVPYFHVVFTLPQQIGRLALPNAKPIYNILFHAASRALLETAVDPRLLGASIGFLAVLHTWGAESTFTPTSALRRTGRRHLFRRLPLDRLPQVFFFLPVRVLSRRFRKTFLRSLWSAFRRDILRFHGELRYLTDPGQFQPLCRQASAIEWVVPVKPPFGGPERVLKYLARYNHRAAISNHRLRSLEQGRVSFEWKDYADHSRTKTMTLEAAEFIRRFLLHVLPSGLVRIRQFGFLANRVRQHKLEQCRSLLALCHPHTLVPSDLGGAAKLPDAGAYPICKQGRLMVIELLAAEPIPFLDPS